MEATSNRRENLSWPDQDKVNAQLEAICELVKELRTDYPTDTPDEPTNWSNKARNRRNAIIRAQFIDDFGFTLINGSMWLELFDLLGFSVDKETRKRFASHLKWYSFGYAAFKPRISSKYAQRIHWYVHNFLFCLRNELQTEKDYREGKYGSKGQAYFMEIEQQPATPAETPQISMEAAETVNVSAEGENAAETKEMPRYECPNYADYAFERGWSIENTDFDPHSGVLCMIHFDPSDEKYVCGCLWQINSDKPNYSEHRRFKTLKGAQNYGTKRMGMKLEYQTLTVHYPTTPIEPPQSPETPQAVECTADTLKPRETARKPQNRGIGNTRHSRLGANGYAMLDNASATLTAMHVPRECSTADAAYW